MSSYGLFVDGEKEMTTVYAGSKTRDLISELVDTDRVLEAFRNNPREQYRMFVESKVKEYDLQNVV